MSIADKLISIIGAGGLGVPAAWGIVESWAENQQNLHIQIIDYDKVELGNLNRQVLYKESDIGKNKAETLAHSLSKKNQNVYLSPIVSALNKDNIANLLINSDYVIEASDSIKTKFLVNDFCSENQIPFCYAGAISDHGLLLEVKNTDKNHSPCLNCIFPDYNADAYAEESTTCTHAGILGPVAGFLGFKQAECAIDFLAGRNKGTKGLVKFSLKTLGEERVNVKADFDCPLNYENKK